jgi:hypothetical protein
MRLRKSLLVLTAVMLPVASIALLEGTAFAKKVTGTGNPTCAFGGTISFNPPLTKNGSTSIKKETTTVTASLSSCSGGNPAVPAGNTVSVKPIKTKTAKGKAGGSCSSFTTASSTAVVKVTLKWPGEKPSKFTVNGLHASINAEGEVGFTGSFPITGSYAGTGNLGVYLTSASSTAIATCSGSIASLSIDRAHSSGKL